MQKQGQDFVREAEEQAATGGKIKATVIKPPQADDEETAEDLAGPEATKKEDEKK